MRVRLLVIERSCTGLLYDHREMIYESIMEAMLVFVHHKFT